MARPSGKPALVIWRDFAFVPRGSISDYSEHAIVRFKSDFVVTEVWPLERVLLNLAAMAAQFRIDMDERKHQRHASPDDIRSWVALTRSIAARFPYGGPYREEMRTLADRVEKIHAWSARHLKRPPRGRAEELELRFNCVIWAMNELRKVARQSPAAFWEKRIGALLSFLPEARRPEFDDAAVEKRIKRLGDNVKTGMGASVMAEVLRDVVQYAPMLADGSPRRRIVSEAAETPRSGRYIQ